MNKKLLSVSSLVLGVALLSACFPPVLKFDNSLERVDQDSLYVLAYVSKKYKGPSYFGIIPSNGEDFKFVGEDGKEHWANASCDCRGFELEYNKSRNFQYMVSKSRFPKGTYKVYLKDDVAGDKYKTIEIK